MRTLAIALVLVLTMVSPARASVWDFTWVSEWTGLVFTPDLGLHFETGGATGQSTATVIPIPDGLVVKFDTPAGPAQFGVDSTQPGYPNSQLPFNVPAGADRAPPGGGLQLLPQEPQRFPYGRAFAWTGSFDNPDSFAVDATYPGSGPSPMLHFSGTGSRSVAAAEPSVLGLAGAALGMLIFLRRTGRL